MLRFSSATAIAFICISSVAISQKVKLVKPADVIQQASVLYDSGRYSESAALLLTIPERDTAYDDTASDLVYAYLGMKEFDKAIELTRQHLDKGVDNRVQFLRLEALALQNKGNYKEAVAALEKAIKEYPTDITLIYSLGLMQYDNKEYEKAEQNFFRTLNINPFHRGSHLKLSTLAMGQGRKVHAMMAMGMYLALNHSDNANLVLINNYLDNQVKEEGTIAAFGPNAPAKLDQMIRARIVNEQGFNSKFAVKAAVVQQYELLFDQLATIQGDDDRYVKYYLPIYKSLKDNNAVESFVYHILSSSSIEAAEKWRNKNEKALNAFYAVTNESLAKNRKALTVPELGFEKPVAAWYNDNNQLAALGEMQNEKRTARWIYFHNNSQRSAEGSFLDDVKTGTWTYYYRNGRVKSVENYETGEVTVYTEAGKKSEHFFLKDGEIDGDVELYYESGPVREKLKFAAGKRQGRRDLFFGDGTIKATYNYENGVVEGPYLINYENGQLKERCAYKGENLHGKYEYFHANGRVATLGEYADDNLVGLWKHYYSNGRLQRTGSYNAKGLPIGEWTYYDQRGQLTEKRNFNDEGQFQGEVTYYYNGKLYCTSLHKKDVLIRDTFYGSDGKAISTSGNNDGTYYSKNYFATGQLRSEGNYRKGKAEGNWKFYFRHGGISSEYQYVNNALNGIAKEYFPSGELKIECEYKEGQLHGYYREYYRNGQVKSEGWYQDGNREQQWLSYYNDGTRKSDYYFLQDRNIGKGYEYAPDGIIDSEVEVDQDGNLTNLQFYNEKGKPSSVKRLEKFNDVYEDFYPNRKLKSRSDVLCGQYNGKLSRYFPDGQLHFEYNFVNGQKNGPYTLFEVDGTISSAGTYADDQRQGLWKNYHENGRLYSEGYYLDDNLDSLWTYYHENGNVSARTWYRNDERDGITTEHGPDGTPLLEKLFALGDLVAYRPVSAGNNGEWIPIKGTQKIEINYPNGKPALLQSYKNGLLHGDDILYYPDGQIFKKYHYDNGDLRGEYKAYYPDGKMMETGNYDKDERTGKFEAYAPDGKMEWMETYHLGIRHGKVVFYRKGVPYKQYDFRNGSPKE